MADWITTDRYDNIPNINRYYSFAGIKATKSYTHGDTLDGLFKDTFIAIRGQKRPIPMSARSNYNPTTKELDYLTPFWEKNNGDIIGVLDYAMLLLPVALKIASAALVFKSIEYVAQESKATYQKALKILFGIFALAPSIVLGLAVSVVSWMVDLVKNVLALTITALMTLPVLIPLANRKTKGDTKTKHTSNQGAQTATELGKHHKHLDPRTDNGEGQDSEDSFGEDSPKQSPGRSPRFALPRWGRK